MSYKINNNNTQPKEQLQQVLQLPSVQYQSFPVQQQAIQQGLQNLQKVGSMNQLSFYQSNLNQSQKIVSSILSNQNPSLKQLKPTSQQDQNINQQIMIQQQIQQVTNNNKLIDEDQILRMFRQEDQGNNYKRKDYQNRKSKLQSKNNSVNLKKRESLQNAISGKSGNLHKQDSMKHISNRDSLKQLRQATQLSIHQIEKIKSLVLQYKIQYRSTLFQLDWQKQRYKLRQQLFQSLCIGIYQLKLKSQFSITLPQQTLLKNISKLNQNFIKCTYDFGVFKYCRNLVLQIDTEMFIHFHQRGKVPLSKDYKAQYKYLINNAKDTQNAELRFKLLSRQFNYQQIKIANQTEFFTEAKKAQIKQKQRKLLAQFSNERQPMQVLIRQDFEGYESFANEPQINVRYYSTHENESNLQALNQLRPQLKNNLSQNSSQVQNVQHLTISNKTTGYNKFIDQTSILQMEELLSKDHLHRMRNRLDQDLKGNRRSRLLNQFDQIFIYQM